jgi:signal transduction histidine kinase
MEFQLESVPDRSREPTPARSHRPHSWALLLTGGPIAMLTLRLFPALDQSLLDSPLAHAVIAGSGAAVGLVLALLVIRAGQRSLDARVFLIGLSLLSVASLFVLHALATPGIVLARGPAVGWSALLSLLCGSFLLALSGLNMRAETSAWVMRHQVLWIVTLLGGWLVAAWGFFAPADLASDHAMHQALPSTQSDLARALALAGVICYGFATWRHYRLYRETPTPAGLAITCGVALFGQALAVQALQSGAYTASFWLYHILEGGGFVVISAGILAGWRMGQTESGLLEALFLHSTRSRLQASYSRALESLIETIARGEQPSTTRHRELHERLGLSESQVRVLEDAASAVAQERRQRQELERLNRQLQQLERDKEQLTQMVVHDLKNPLTALIGFLEILRMDASRLSEDHQLLLDGALRSGRSLSGLIADLLDAARLEEGQLDLNYSLFTLDDLLRDCAGELGAWMLQEEKDIRIETPGGSCSVVADRRLLRRVVINLLSNAIKHTPSGTRVILRGYHAPAAAATLAVFEVEDDGPGIPPAFLDRIFDKFSRLATDGHARQQSTGLGLTFCRLAVEAHRGTIEVRSTLGQGTVFRVALPLTSL